MRVVLGDAVVSGRECANICGTRKGICFTLVTLRDRVLSSKGLWA